MWWKRCLFLVVACWSLASCRLVLETQGAGFIYAENAAQLYRNGTVLDINEDFDEVFLPIPAPGRKFRQWHNLCVKIYDACPLVLTREAWEQDQDFPLRAQFTGNYRGPLELRDFELWWYPFNRELAIPVATLQVAGVAPGSPVRPFVATLDLRRVIPAVRRGGEYVFPLGPNDEPDDFWPFVSARDRAGIIASTSLGLDMEDLASSPLQPHNSASRWADLLKRCSTPLTLFDLCTLDALPFIGKTTGEVDSGDIMLRTLVSHRWMGRRFRELLLQLPPEMLQMFRSVTAVVISSEVRPSFYHPATGAIYLDPQDLWLTPGERATVGSEADYRDAFQSAFQLLPFWLYVDGNTEAWVPSAQWPEGHRRHIDDILLPMATLLIHELTHANDTVPAAQLVYAGGNSTPLDVASRLFEDNPSARLYETYPLVSPLLYRLAASMFNGVAPDAELLRLSARDAGLEFASEYATDLYAFASSAEDTAMLVEEVMARHYFGIDRIVAFLDEPDSLLADCNDYLLRWGSRSRVFTPAIKERARLVLADVLDESDLSAYLNATPRSQTLSAGRGLCSYFSLRTFDTTTRGQSIALPERSNRPLNRVQRHLEVRKTVERGHHYRRDN